LERSIRVEVIQDSTDLIVIMERGMHLITFSLFGDNPLYCEGAVENARSLGV
jgi:hypothetical protein